MRKNMSPHVLTPIVLHYCEVFFRILRSFLKELVIKYIIGIVFEYASMYWATAAVKLFFARDTHTYRHLCMYLFCRIMGKVQNNTKRDYTKLVRTSEDGTCN